MTNKIMAVTNFINEDESFKILEMEDGTLIKVTEETSEEEISGEEMQALIDTGKYTTQEITL